MRLEVEREQRRAYDLFTMQRWTFVVRCDTGDSRVTIRLDSYREFERPSRRHKWRVQKRWDRLSGESRYNTLGSAPCPEDVQAEVMQEVMDGIIVEVGTC